MEDFVQKFLTWSHNGLIASFGGAASFVYLASKSKKFAPWLFLANIFVSFYVGTTLAPWVNVDPELKDGVVSLLGFFAYPILHFLEGKVLAYLEKRASNIVG